MPGERTPDTSPDGKSGSSDDEISLREHMQRQLDAIRQNTAMLMEQERVYFERVIHEHRVKLDERFDTAKEFNIEQDRRYEQRFVAQEQAVSLAIDSVRTETHVALQSADKAIAKSEVASEKRFESVNEFRAQLGDQAATFMTRTESLSRHDRTTEQLSEMTKRAETEARLARERSESDLDAVRDRFQNDISTINSRLDRQMGNSVGSQEAVVERRASMSAILALVGMGITIILAGITVVGFIVANK